MAWINIKWTDERVQNIIGKWEENRILTIFDWDDFCKVYQLSLASNVVPAGAYFKNKTIIIPENDNVLQLQDSSLFDSQKLKFKLNDTLIRTVNKNNNIYRIGSSIAPVVLYLTDVGINIINYYSYRWGEQSESLLGNAFLGDTEIETSNSNQIISKNGFITYKGYRSLGAPISGLGANIPYENHQSFDTSGKGYQYFDFINKNDSFKYIGYFSNKDNYNSGHWGENGEFIDKNNNAHYGPFVVLKYDNRYASATEKASWRGTFVSDIELIRKNLEQKWFIYSSKNTQSQITSSEILDFLNQQVVVWESKDVVMTLNNMSIYFSIELPKLGSSAIEDVNNLSPYTNFNLIPNTNTYHLVQTFQSSSQKKYFDAQTFNDNNSSEVIDYWTAGAFSNVKKWALYRSGGYEHPWFIIGPVCRDKQKYISILKSNFPIQIQIDTPNNYPYQYIENQSNWTDRMNVTNDLTCIRLGPSTENANQWIMKDFVDLRAKLQNNTEFHTIISLARDEWPISPHPQFLTNSLSSWNMWQNENEEYVYSFLTIHSENDAPQTISLVFAVKNLAGEDFSDPNAAN